MDIVPELMANLDQLEGIFMPEAARRRAEMRARNGRFVHYTSAEAAHAIISGRSMWMRNTSCMNDFSEIHHGHALLRRCLMQESAGLALQAALNECVQGSANMAIQQYDHWWNDMQVATYIACLSEHDDREDAYGRLSMWRAYGGKGSASVALVLRVPLENGRAVPLGVVFTPVAYMEAAEVCAQMRTITANIQNNATYLAGLSPELVWRTVFAMLRMATVSLKHAGFMEEKEWRVACWPNMSRPVPDPITCSPKAIGGLPQKVYSIPFRGRADGGVDGLDIASVIDRVIIGPTQYPLPMIAVFQDALRDAGVTNPEQRVFASNIPLRT